MSYMEPQTENEAYEILLCGHLQHMVYNLRQIPHDKWDWTYAPPAPTPRILAAHALHWLICDRQHIAELDAALHPRVPEVPTDPDALCDALDAETKNWSALLCSLTSEQFGEMRSQFNQFPMNIRAFVAHSIQHCIYKNGQLATIYFALGLDGDAPYEAPFPNTYYDELSRSTPAA